MDGFWYTVEISLTVEPHADLVWSVLGREQNSIEVCLSKHKTKQKRSVCLHSDVYRIITFEFGMMYTTEQCTFKVTFLWESRDLWEFCVHFLVLSSIDFDEIWYAAMTCQFVGPHVKIVS